VEGSCEHGNEPLGSIKCLEILEYLSDWRPLRKGSAPWSYVFCSSCLSFVLSVFSVCISFRADSLICHVVLKKHVNQYRTCYTRLEILTGDYEQYYLMGCDAYLG
jgi:hypothetical protein